MMGGYVSRLVPVEVDSEADSSEGEPKGLTFISSSTSFKTENAEVRIDNDDDDDDCLGTPSLIPTPSPPPSEDEVSQPSTTPLTLTHEQQQVLDYVRAGEVHHLNTSQQCI